MSAHNLNKILFSKREKTKPNWVDEIREDVIDECAKYGGIVHIHVDEHAPDGNVYIKCPSIAIANAAMSGLHGRYFGSKKSEYFLLLFPFFICFSPISF